MKELDYPLTYAALKEAENHHESDQWAIGDALLAECGPPSESSVNDGSWERLKEVAQRCSDIWNLDQSYSIQHLSRLRATSFHFGEPARFAKLSWGAHRAAGTPEFLKAVIKGAPKGTKISQDYVEGIKQRQVDEARREREEEEAKAQAEREKAEAEEAQARNEEERSQAKAKTEKAKEKERATKTAPKRKPQPPEERDVPIRALEARFLGNAAGSVKVAQESAKLIKELLPYLTPKGVAALTEAALEAANAWTEAARLVRNELVDESGHLSVLER